MHEIIEEDQTGFIRGRRAQDNIWKTIHIVEEAKKRGESVLLVNMDAEKAFDSMRWTCLYNVLKKFGLIEDSSNVFSHCIMSQQQE